MSGAYQVSVVSLLSLLASFAVSQAQPTQSKLQSTWQAEWERVVKVAKEEGSVVVLGPPGGDVRRALSEGFEKSFPGIKVEYTGATGSTMAPKLLAERRAGQYLADIHVGNPGTMLTSLLPARALDPIPSVLILPDAIDSSKWWQGKLDFADPEKHTLVFSTNVMTHVAVNPQAVKKGEIRSYLDLLNSKWQAKIAMYDPTILGPGSGTFTFWHLHPALGKDFLRKFFTQQKVTLSRDNRQLLEWLVKGDYAIAVAPSDLHATELIAKGLSIGLLHADQFKEGGLLNAGFGGVAVINRPSHPNAAKVYINWLLSKEGQMDFSKATGYPSRRLDVPRDQFDPAVLPKEGFPYILGYGTEYSRVQVEASQFAKSLLQK